MKRPLPRLDPPLTAEEWLILAIVCVLGLAGGYAYGRWLWGTWL